MNASGLGLAAILLVVLLAVVWGAQQMDAAQQNQISQLMQQRDQAMALAQEAKAQRDDISGEMALLKGRIGDLQAGMQQKDEQIAAVNGQLEEARKVSSEQAARAKYLEGRVGDLQVKNADLQRQVQTTQANASAMIPNTGQGEALPAEQPAQSSPDCPAGAVNVPRSPMGDGLVMLISMVALGGSGYVLYHEKTHAGL